MTALGRMMLVLVWACAAMAAEQATGTPASANGTFAVLPAKPAQGARVVFGSCLRNPDGGAILGHVPAMAPDQFLWLGDAIYADDFRRAGDLAHMRRLYDRLRANPRVQALRAACPQQAIWDDHDFGKNNIGGADWPQRDEVQRIFCDAWDLPRDDSRRTRKGLYHSLLVGEVPRCIQIILLDGRYFLRHDEDPDKRECLGEEQWAWLAGELVKPAQVRLICSGIQVLNTSYSSAESWGQFPRERARLFQLITTAKAQGVVFLSGDMHFSELSAVDHALAYPAYDFTSSGIDQKLRQLPFTDRGIDQNLKQFANPTRVGTLVNQPNLGVVTIDWSLADPAIDLHTAIGDGSAILQQRIPLSRLR